MGTKLTTQNFPSTPQRAARIFANDTLSNHLGYKRVSVLKFLIDEAGLVACGTSRSLSSLISLMTFMSVSHGASGVRHRGGGARWLLS